MLHCQVLKSVEKKADGRKRGQRLSPSRPSVFGGDTFICTRDGRGDFPPLPTDSSSFCHISAVPPALAPKAGEEAKASGRVGWRGRERERDVGTRPQKRLEWALKAAVLEKSNELCFGKKEKKKRGIETTTEMGAEGGRGGRDCHPPPELLCHPSCSIFRCKPFLATFFTFCTSSVPAFVV